MISSATILVALLLSPVAWYGYGYWQNRTAAKSTGLPYISLPWPPFALWWQVTRPFVLPTLRQLPGFRDAEWLPFMQQDWVFKGKYAPFARHGDVFILVTPNRNIIVVADAEMLYKMSLRREHFIKHLASYDILRPFGENILTTEGTAWRMHRKASAPAFNEKNMALVFHQAILQAQSMANTWIGPQDKRGPAIRTLMADTMRIALHVIGYVGFGVQLLWPGEILPEGIDPKTAKYASHHPLGGHSLSFVDALETMLDYIVLILVFPSWLLKRLPFKQAKLAHRARNEFYQYSNELVDEKMEEQRAGENGARNSMDIMGQLVSSSLAEEKEKGGKDVKLDREAVISNTFLILVAGHETAASVLHFSIVELANNPATQRRLHRELDEMIGSTNPRAWNYDKLVKPMMESLVMACLNETMRLMPPVVSTPKQVSPGRDQAVTMNGKEYVLPQGTTIHWANLAVQRNPRYWPSKPSTLHPGQSDINDWVPSRWFRTGPEAEGRSEQQGWGEAEAKADLEDVGSYEDPDVGVSKLFQPERGAYIPFSEGARGCIGKRMAQVEMLAILSVIFQKYSVELAVDEWASDEEVESMSRGKREELYETAREKSRKTIDTSTMMLSLRIPNGSHIPVRFVRRGEERFVSWMDKGKDGDETR